MKKKNPLSVSEKENSDQKLSKLIEKLNAEIKVMNEINAALSDDQNIKPKIYTRKKIQTPNQNPLKK